MMEHELLQMMQEQMAGQVDGESSGLADFAFGNLGEQGIPDELMVQEIGPSRAERTAELISRFRYAESYRKQYDDKAVECYKLYVGYAEDAKVAGRSNLHIPRTYEHIDTLRARFVKSFFTTRPYVDFLPLPSYGDNNPMLVSLNDEKAKVASSLVDEQLDRNSILRKFYDFVTEFCIFPAAIMGVGWRYEERTANRVVPQVVGFVNTPYGPQPMYEQVEVQEQSVVWDDNEIVNIDFFDFWPDPRGKDIDSCRFVFHRDWVNAEQLEHRLALLAETGVGEVYPLDLEELKDAGEGLEEGKWERLSAVGLSPETSSGFWSEGDTDGLKTGKLFELLYYWEDGRQAILVNRNQLAYDGPNPYWRHGKKPFVVASFEPLPNEFYGLSAVQLLEHLQHELNTHRNQRIDNVSMALNRMMMVRRGADIDESELVSRPNGIIYVDNHDDIQEFEMKDVTSSGYMEESIIKQDMEGALGVPAVVRGADPQRRETATEVVTKSNNASIRFDVKIMLFEAMGLKRLTMLMDMNNQQFIDMPRLARVYGEDAAFYWQQVEPGQLIGEYDYRPSGANVDPAANKEVRRQQLLEAMQVVFTTQNPFVDPYQLTKMWLESYDLRNVDKLLISQEELMQRQMQQMMMAQQMQQGQMAGQGMNPQMPPGAI